MHYARFRSRVPAPVSELFAWHARPGAFERLAPPWQRIDIVERSGTIRDGDRLAMDLRLGPFSRRWVSVHSDYVDGVQFRDTQVEGPFRHWVHTHFTRPDATESSILDDQIAYTPPGGNAALRLARHEVRRLFRYRHFRTAVDLMRHQQFRRLPRLSVAIVGDHPLARQLEAFLSGGGHHVTRVGEAPVTVDLTELVSSHSIARGRESAVVLNSRKAPDVTVASRQVTLICPAVILGPSFGWGGVIASAARDRLRLRSRRWIAEDDLIGAIHHALMDDTQSGVFSLAHEPETAGHGIVAMLPGFVRLYHSESFARRALTGRVRSG